MQNEDRNKVVEHFWHNTFARSYLEGENETVHMLKAILIIFIRRKSLTEAAARAESECVNILLPAIYIRSKRFGKKFGSEQLPMWLFVKGCLKHSTQRN